MKKILLLMAIFLPFMLNSCGDDKDILSSQEQELVGEWAIVKLLTRQTTFTTFSRKNALALEGYWLMAR